MGIIKANMQALRSWLLFHIPFLFTSALLRNLDKEGESILDVGCGRGEPLMALGKQKRFYAVGIDIFEPYLRESAKKVYDEVILGDVRKIPLKTKSLDVVLCLNVLEHLEKEEGKRLIGAMEEIARRQIILLVPHGFIAKPAYNGNPFQTHKASWSVQELKESGFTVRGLNFSGLRWINKLFEIKEADGAISRILKKYLRILVQNLTGWLPWLFPRLGRTLFCTKKL